MNFEMAQEMAEMEDIQVEMVVVKDDISVSKKRKDVVLQAQYAFINM